MNKDSAINFLKKKGLNDEFHLNGDKWDGSLAELLNDFKTQLDRTPYWKTLRKEIKGVRI